jgi:hypothetical protein
LFLVIAGAAFIYTFHNLRELARDGKISDPDSVLVEPISFLKILELTWLHRDDIEEHLGADYDFFVDVLDDAEKYVEVEAFRLGKENGYRTLGATPEKFGVVAFEDKHNPAEEGGLVYMIEVDW